MSLHRFLITASVVIAATVLVLTSGWGIGLELTGITKPVHAGPAIPSPYRPATDPTAQHSQNPAVTIASQQAGIVSDDFNCPPPLAPVWTFVQPLGDGGLTISDGQVHISVPEGVAHDMWGTEDTAYTNTSQRIVQPAADTDFEIEVKFDSGLGLRYQQQGIVIQQDYNSLLRLEFLSNGSGKTHIYTAKFQNGLVDVVSSLGGDPIADAYVAPLYMRVKRENDQWTVYYSFDGSIWEEHVTYSHPMTVTKVGVYAGNSKEVSHTAVIDYFYNTQKPGDGDLSYAIASSVKGRGSVVLNPHRASYVCGEKVSIRAKPDSGWRFHRWSGDVSGTKNPVQLTVARDHTVIAHFVQEVESNYDITVNTVGNGSVAIVPSGPYVSGEDVTLEAQPENGWGFVGWSGDLSGAENPSTLTVTRDQVVTATFSAEIFFIVVQVDGNGRVDVTPSQKRAAGQDAVFTATPDDGWRFAGWSGDLSGTENPSILTVTGNHRVIATFVQIKYSVTTDIEGNGTIVVTPKGPYVAGQEITLEARPAAGSRFVTWGGDLVALLDKSELTTPVVSITVNRNLNVTARFETKGGAVDDPDRRISLPLIENQK